MDSYRFRSEDRAVAVQLATYSVLKVDKGAADVITCFRPIRINRDVVVEPMSMLAEEVQVHLITRVQLVKGLERVYVYIPAWSQGQLE